MSIKFKSVETLLEHIEYGRISVIHPHTMKDFFGEEFQTSLRNSHRVYYDAHRKVFFTEEIYDVFDDVIDLIKFYRDNVGEVRCFSDGENKLFISDIEAL